MVKISKKTKSKIKIKTTKSISKKSNSIQPEASSKHIPKSKKEKSTLVYKKISPAYIILFESLKLLIKGWKSILKIVLIYLIIYIILVLGLTAPVSVKSVATNIPNIFHGSFGTLEKNINIYGLLLSSITNPNYTTNSGAFNLILFIILSLVFIWSIRKIYNNQKFKVKDAYYRSMYPFIPFILIMILISIQLLPMVIGFSLYNYVINGGIAVGVLEKIVWAITITALFIISLYFIGSSFFALLISTLENVNPMMALRSAKKMVKKRRWLVILKLIFMPIAVFILIGIIMLIDILVLPVIAPYLLGILLIIALFIAYSYLYIMYRELINE